MRKKLKKILAERLGVEVTDIENSTSLQDLGVDALTLSQILEDLYLKAGVEIPPKEARSSLTVEDLLNLAEEYSKTI